MSDRTEIAWTDATWPIVNGCRRVSRGCGAADGGGCYAERLAATRLAHTPKYAGLAKMTTDGPRWTGETRLWAEHLDWPLRWKRPRRIFVADMGDLFYEGVRDEDIEAVFGVMSFAGQHWFQVLTKRPERARDWIRNASLAKCQAEATVRLDEAKLWSPARRRDRINSGTINGPWPLPHVWIGTSVEDQATADARIPVLLDTPAAVRWVSYEPALGPVNFTEIMPETLRLPCGSPARINALTRTDDEHFYNEHEALDWIVVGGESGPGARPFDIAWARETIRQCRAAQVPCFVKQLGARAVIDDEQSRPWPAIRDAKGADPSEWPEDLRIREFPGTDILAGDAACGKWEAQP